METGISSKINYFEWSIAGNLDGQSPNILSELKFSRITSIGYYIKGNYSLLKYLEVSIDFLNNDVISGRGIDTDYKEDNRNNPTFEKEFISNKGSLRLLRGGIGIPIFVSKKIKISPSLFYHWTKQKYYILSHDNQDLRSTYQTNMRGAEISLVSHMKLTRTIFSSLELGYHFVKYKAEANWNLIDIFEHPLSFSQSAKGSGYNMAIEFGHNFNKMFSVIMEGELDIYNIQEGIDTSYLVTGKEISTQFNGAKNILFGSKLGIRVSF